MNYIKSSYTIITFVALLLVTGIITGCDDNSSMTGSEPEEALQSESYNYAFNEGQLLDDPETAYNADNGGEHARNLTATMNIEEMQNGNASVTVTLSNTSDGWEYPVHVHDAADPESTPNSTPYNETPNGDVFAGTIEGNGGDISLTNETEIAYNELITEYEGFFVVHDPTQELSTTNLATYLVLGVFAQDLDEKEPMLKSQSFEYDFNEGQLLNDPNTAYSEDGEHPRDLTATFMVEELLDGRASVTVTLNNTLEGEDYAVHSHDAADPDTTENGTPYNETPNVELSAGAITGTGNEASVTFETENVKYFDIINDYEGFFVVHDPLQPVTTTDLTTYLILGLTAR